MTDVATAQDYCDRLIKIELPRTGTVTAAMKFIAAREGMDFGFIWSLRYRPAKTVKSEPFRKLKEAYGRALRRQALALQTEIARTKAVQGDDAEIDLAAAEALVSQALLQIGEIS